MHQYDPNGSTKAYRKERDRRENQRTLLFCAAAGMGIVILYALVTITISLVEGWRS